MTDEEKAFKRAYYEANREEIRIKQLEYSRRPEVKARTRQRYMENREHRLAYAKDYYYKYVKENK